MGLPIPSYPALALLCFTTLVVAKGPNFIFILTDDQDILLNGTSAMPVLQSQLIEAGVSFRGFVDVPVCCPSRTSTLSGRYSHNLNNTELGWCGDFGAKHEGNTWIRTLKDAGYNTALFGKVWALLLASLFTVQGVVDQKWHPWLQYYNDYGNFCERNVHVPADFSYVNLMCDDNKYFNNTFNISEFCRRKSTQGRAFLFPFRSLCPSHT